MAKNRQDMTIGLSQLSPRQMSGIQITLRVPDVTRRAMVQDSLLLPWRVKNQVWFELADLKHRDD